MGETENTDYKFLLETIRKASENGRVVLMTVEGLVTYDIDQLISQPTEGLLYDLNRDLATTSTLLLAGAELPTLRLVNDYATALVIKRLKEKLESNGTKE